MFTLEQIEEIHRKLQLFGVKDKDLPILTEQLNGNEIITVVKDGRNVLLLISQLLDFNSFTAELLESLRGPQGNDGKNAYQTWLSQGNVGTYDDYIAVLQLPALLAAETSTIRVNNKLNEADVVIEELNSLSNQTQESLSEMNSAKDLAYETVTHPPVIIDKYWHSWNHETNQYDTTYIKAEGDDAYEIWLEAGNVGTLEDYLEDIKGDTGKYGETKFVINDNMELEQHTLIGDPLNFSIVNNDLVLTEDKQTVNLGKVGYRTYNQLTDPTLTGTVINGDRWIYGGIPFTIYERIYDVWMVISGGYNSSFIPKIGDYYICGTVFYIDTVNRFIMVADLDAMVKKYWIQGSFSSFLAQDLSINSGEINTDTIISATSSADTAALYCKNYEKEGYADWFLPTLYNTEMLNGFISILPVNANPWTSESYSDYRYAYYVSKGTKIAEYGYLPKDTIPVKKINY